MSTTDPKEVTDSFIKPDEPNVQPTVADAIEKAKQSAAQAAALGEKGPEMPDPQSISEEEKKLIKGENLLELEEKKKLLREYDLEILHLNRVNVKLTRELKRLSEAVDKSLQRAKAKNIIGSAAREKELENAQKQIHVYQKEIASLKAKVEGKSGYDKVAELEVKLKESLAAGVALQKEIKALNQLQKNQGKELERIITNQEYENKIKGLNEHLKRLKDRAKALEQKIGFNARNDEKLKEYVRTLNEKFIKLKTETESSKRATSGSASMRKQEHPTENTKDIEELKTSIKSLKTVLDKERGSNKKELETALLEMNDLRKHIKDTEQENRLNALKLKELTRVIKSGPADSKPQKNDDGKLKRSKRETSSIMKKRPKAAVIHKNSNQSMKLIRNGKKGKPISQLVLDDRTITMDICGKGDALDDKKTQE